MPAQTILFTAKEASRGVDWCMTILYQILSPEFFVLNY